MLVLTRHKLQVIVLQVNKADIEGDSLRIEICALGWRGDQMRIGTEAPSCVQIDRLEIAERKEREKRYSTETLRLRNATPATGLDGHT